MARSLELQKFFQSVNLTYSTMLHDSGDDVYVFLFNQNLLLSDDVVGDVDDQLPNGIFPTVSNCYSFSCNTYNNDYGGSVKGCYSVTCNNYIYYNQVSNFLNIFFVSMV
jgi:hypothetical protein